VPVRAPSPPFSVRGRLRWHWRFQWAASELGKFCVVGAAAFLIDTAVFNAALTAMDNWLPAAVVSTTVSATFAFIGNRFWTWRDRPRSSLHREYVLYAIFNVIGLLISLGCLWISHDLLGMWQPAIFHSRLSDNIAKQGFGLVLGTAFRFWAYRRYVFVSVSQPSQPEPVPEGSPGA
jgi:putative flippase GtrA